MADSGEKTRTPFVRLIYLVIEDRRELIGIATYALLSSVLLLAIPLTAQALVNVSAAGLAVQPLIVLAGALFFGLLFAGLLTCSRYYLAEHVLQRIFCRKALKVAQKLPQVKSRHLCQSGGPELMNRFFDIMNIQKSWFKLVYDGPGAVLEILLGLGLLALYGIELFATAAFFIVVGAAAVVLMGMGGVRTSISASARKYQVAEWLEEMVRCQDALRLNSLPGFWTQEADLRIVGYLDERRRHFRVLLRQYVAHYLVTAAGLAGMLGYGGYLVLQGQLSLGQLVAAELVIWSLFKATEKLLRACAAYFALLTGLDKVGYITDLPQDSVGRTHLSQSAGGVELVVENVSYFYQAQAPALANVTFTVPSGQRLTILGPTGSGKSTLVRVLGGYANPETGAVELDLIDVRELSPEAKSEAIGYYSERNELFAGSVIDNVALGRGCDLHRVRELLLETGGKEALRRGEQGGYAPLSSSGSNLSEGERASVLLSRAILLSPRLLLIDGPLGQVSERTQREFVEKLFLAETRPTIVSTCPSPAMVQASDRVLILENGRIVEQGDPLQLADDPESRMRFHYPTLCESLLKRKTGPS